MAILARNPVGLHGYVIGRQLVNTPFFSGTPPDNTGLYRLLSAMEAEGCLESGWDTEGSGPARRIYKMTAKGLGCLRRWEGTLKTYARTVEETAAFVEQSLLLTEKADRTLTRQE